MRLTTHLSRTILAGLVTGALSVGAQAQTDVTIGTAKDPNLAAQIIIADEKGFFEEAGLNADIKFFPSGGDLMAAFVGGSVDFGSSGSTPTMILRSRPFPVEIVAQIADISGAQQLIVHEDVSGIDDLKGKKIGLMRGTASEALLESILEDQGADPSDFELVNLGPSEMVQAFVRGDVAAVALWETHTTRAREAGNGKTLASGAKSFYGGEEKDARVYGDHAVLFTSDDYLSGNEDTVKSVLEAIVKATKFIDENTDEAVSILADTFSLTEDQMAYIAEANDYTVRLDDTMVSDMNKLAGFLKSRGKMDDPEDVSDWIAPDALKSVASDEVSLSE